MKKILRLMALLLSLNFLWGCELFILGAGAGLGIGAYKYIEGSLSREYPLSYGKAWDATNAAMAKLLISVSNSVNEGSKGTIEAVRKDGAQVSINLKDMGQGVTSISVRVGRIGDRQEAERVHDEIAAQAGLK